MIIDSFRAKLRKEAEIWRDEGIIEDSQYEQLSQRYQFDSLDNVAQDRFIFILIGVGCILVGLGAITFVAANWQSWSREVKLVLLLSLFFATNIIGFFLWREPVFDNAGKKRRQRKRIFGHGLLLLGALLLGANMAFMAQTFHMSGSDYELYLFWGMGVLVMAYGLRLASLGVFSLILIGIGYFSGLSDLWYSASEYSLSMLMLKNMPILWLALFVPLAYLCQSRWIFALSTFLFAISVQFNSNRYYYPYWIKSFAFALPPAFLWSYDDLLFYKVNQRWFQSVARNFALLFFSVLFYVFSFRMYWRFSSEISSDNNSILNILLFIDLGIITLLAVYQWFNLLRPKPNSKQKNIDITNIGIGIFTASAAFAPIWSQHFAETSVLAIIIFNLFLGILACGMIRQGLQSNKRRAFWGGMILLTLQIITRMLEYDTALLLKSLVFILCGIAVIGAGLWFERHLNSVSSEQ
ncbi:hypothetical protein NIES267_69930 [Calothrix parasitica NIES-267]|uniref:DUF2157 domain-containing protein n=1 Tax=Calothrix parasitica NIES-267 TaxID=1973488 RepID=A0A1Z4M243_9CYAN|nr:hypothetical protein NIES267_69930 [Calothrix parasitica NIES-267]